MAATCVDTWAARMEAGANLTAKIGHAVGAAARTRCAAVQVATWSDGHRRRGDRGREGSAHRARATARRGREGGGGSSSGWQQRRWSGGVPCAGTGGWLLRGHGKSSGRVRRMGEGVRRWEKLTEGEGIRRAHRRARGVELRRVPDGLGQRPRSGGAWRRCGWWRLGRARRHSPAGGGGGSGWWWDRCYGMVWGEGVDAGVLHCAAKPTVAVARLGGGGGGGGVRSEMDDE